jgi:hypothetical protein
LDKSSKENLASDIEHQLDDFFDEGIPSDPAGADPVSLEKLKSLVLSIDWEITESCLTDLIDETDTLLPQFQDDRFSHTLLRMLKAVGRYIRRRQAQAHPDAIKRIMSVFASLEKLTGSLDLEEETRKGIVAKEIAAFKKLKEQVEIQRGGSRPSPSAREADRGYVECDQFEQAMSAVEMRLNSQVEDLKAQLETLQKELEQIRGGAS